MLKYIQNKKGQSLVEVTVAMSILAVVLTGVVTLAVNATGLMVASRSRTEATAYAQQGLESLKGDVENSCVSLVNSDFVNMPIVPASTYSRRKKIDGATGLSADYALVTIEVSWTNGSGGNITLKQIMKRK